MSRLTRQHVTNVREHLAELGDIGGEVNPHVLADVVDILGNDVAMCRRLKPDAFSLFIEVLLVTRESDVRARGLYILAVSILTPQHSEIAKNGRNRFIKSVWAPQEKLPFKDACI